MKSGNKKPIYRIDEFLILFFFGNVKKTTRNINIKKKIQK